MSWLRDSRRAQRGSLEGDDAMTLGYRLAARAVAGVGDGLLRLVGSWLVDGFENLGRAEEKKEVMERGVGCWNPASKSVHSCIVDCGSCMLIARRGLGQGEEGRREQETRETARAGIGEMHCLQSTQLQQPTNSQQQF